MSTSVSRAVSIRIGVVVLALCAADRPAERDAVEAGSITSSTIRSNVLRARALERLPAVGDLLDVEPGERQVETQQFADRRLVFDDQNAAARGGRGGAGNRYR